MNRVYKVIWNNVRGCYVVASEFAKAHGKNVTRMVLATLFSGSLFSGAAIVQAAAIINGDRCVVTGVLASAMGYMTHATGFAALAVGNGTTASGPNSFAVGANSVASGNTAIAMGAYSKATWNDAIAMGWTAEASNYYAIALGSYTKASGRNSIAMGIKAQAKGENSLAAIGGTSDIEAKNSVAIGVGAKTLQANTFAIGAGAEAKSSDTVAIGNNAIASHANSVALGAGSVTDRENSIAVGNRQITGVAAGTAENDAVNCKQMWDTFNASDGIIYEAIEDLQKDVARIESEGTLTDKTLQAGKGLIGQYNEDKKVYTVGIKDKINDTFHFAQEIFDASGQATDVNKSGVKVYKGNDRYYSSSLTEEGLTVNEGTHTVEVTATGIDMGGSKITNVAEGTLSQESRDAVNGSQLFATNQAVATNKKAIEDEVKAREQGDADTLKKANAYTDAAIGTTTKELEHKINNTNDRVDRVGATAAALAAINYQPMAKGQSQVAIGMGGYKGKKATALGLAYQISDRVSGSVAGSANGSEHMFNVGFNYVFGQHSDKDVAQCAAVPGSMSLKEAELQAKIDSQDAKINTLEADNAAMKADNAAMKADNQAMKTEIAELKAMMKALIAK